MQQVYIASPKPQYNSEVQVIQRQLNSIRSGLLHNLPIVREDGFYGVETARAIKAFQQTCNIKVDGILGPQTHACMMQKLREMPSIGAAPSRYTIGPVTVNQKGISPSGFSLNKVVDKFVEAVLIFNSTLKSVAHNVANLKDPSSEMVFRCFKGSLEKIDPTLKKMREALSKYHQYNNNSSVSADTLKLAKGNSLSQSLQGRIAAQTVSKANTNKRMAKYYLKEATSAKDAILNNLKQYDFVSKISSKLKSMGLSNKVNLSKIKIKGAGVGVVFIYSLKDIIWDIFHLADLFDVSKKEAWLDDFKKDCYEFLDGLIIGCISYFLAQLIVVAGGAVAGLTISSGAIIMAIVIVSLIISLIFSYVLCSKDISFSRFIFEDCAEFIISKIYGVSL